MILSRISFHRDGDRIFFSRIERNNLFLESENINSGIVNIQVIKDVQNFRFTFKCNLTNY